MNNWRTLGYSCVVIPMPYLGSALGRLVDNPYRESVETIPVLICLLFILRLPTPSHRPGVFSKIPRVVLLLAPFTIVPLMAVPSYPGAVILLTAVIDAIAIGVSEEVTFRFSLHRIWSQYGDAFFLVASALIFGVMHFPGGMGSILVSTVLGLLFGLSRIGRMPIFVLILFHALIDLPGRVAVYLD